MSTGKYLEHAVSRCLNVKLQYPDNWRGELLVRRNKLVKRNNQQGDPYLYDKSEIEYINQLLKSK